MAVIAYIRALAASVILAAIGLYLWDYRDVFAEIFAWMVEPYVEFYHLHMAHWLNLQNPAIIIIIAAIALFSLKAYPPILIGALYLFVGSVIYRALMVWGFGSAIVTAPPWYAVLLTIIALPILLIIELVRRGDPQSRGERWDAIREAIRRRMS